MISGGTMRIVVQRVAEASVETGGEIVGAIGLGLLILVGVREGDTERDADQLAQKVFGLRVFADADGKMNLSAADVGGCFLAVSQFTLYADTSRGRRPSFVQAARPQAGEALYQRFVAQLSGQGANVKTGRFGAEMKVRLLNDGPVTLVIDSETAS